MTAKPTKFRRNTRNTKFTKPILLTTLRNLRQEIEQNTAGLTLEQSLLLVDVCQALGFHDSEIFYVVGEAFNQVEQPVQQLSYQIAQAA